MPSDLVRDGDWVLFDHDPVTGKKTWHLDMGTHIIQRTDTPVDELFDRNAELVANSVGKRFGDGQVVASIPMDVFYNPNLGLSKAFAEGDRAYLKRWMNSSDNAKFRTFRGNV